MSSFEDQLLVRREALLAFIRSKVGDTALAEDILQDSLLRALQAAPGLRSDERLIPWVYQIVRNAITDSYRRRSAAGRQLEAYAREMMDVQPDEGDVARLCACFRAVLPTMNADYALLIERLDLGGASRASVADDLGISANNLKVKHHRARSQLRARLEETCRTCARHGCVDCTCAEVPSV